MGDEALDQTVSYLDVRRGIGYNDNVRIAVALHVQAATTWPFGCGMPRGPANRHCDSDNPGGLFVFGGGPMAKGKRKRYRKAWVAKRRGADGKLRYDVRWVDRAGKVRSEMAGMSLATARKAAESKENELNNYGDIKVVKWDDFVKEHLESLHQKSERYRLDNTRTLERFADFATAYVCDLEVGNVEAFYHARLRSDVSISSANRELRTLKAALSHAVRLKYLRTNPACEIKPEKAPLPPRRVLSPEECRKLLKACSGGYWKAVIYTALTTGMRRGELLHLEWQDVDLTTGMIQVVNRGDSWTKSRKNRTTSTDREGCRLLTRIRVNHPDAVKVFTGTAGVLTAEKIDRGFKDIVEAAKIKKCTLHDLRRTSLTILATKLPAFALQQRAGHVSPSTTATYYLGDVSGVSAKVANAAFEGLFGGGEVEQQR